ncbi:FAD-binding oxidoreductase [Flavobacterium sp. SUN052]|uniref:NAD(P)/FAD-dependent oxidoreductase n=1 Tax=Flavobacterium sp. SUN052 TaxID=3002441 RepID=UPI00237EC9EA|nr:FAD-binding oxidoreductase [Flavobacterium sp. SUN052]MEC4003034.1 FAD-binding oxidoreductase [Flavobacterium sp. SUN052]
MLDYIIVGSGLAGIAFSEIALQHNKSILVINNQSQNSTRIAGGLYNPVILKRFSEVWQAQQQLDLLYPFYANLEKKLYVKLDYKLALLRKFYSVEEQNNWFTASDKPNLSNYLSTNLITTKWNAIPSPFNFGEVLHSGYVDTALLLESYRSYLIKENLYLEDTFDYAQLTNNTDFIEYKKLKAKHIIFAEGFGMLLNPFFNKLPLDGTKGELLIIKAPNLNLEVIMKSSIFVIPLGNDLYKVGATYNWEDKTNIPTESAKKELIDNLSELISCAFEIIEHQAGVRPTVKDRRPLVGTHPIHNNLHVLNGLGTRGVMLAPAMALSLFNHIEHHEPLDENIDIRRIKNFVSSFYQSGQKD